jgi:hypothetical protein
VEGMVRRQRLVECVVAALEAQPSVHAVWLEGADAAGTADAYSDLDLWADVDVGSQAQVFACIRAALPTLGPLDVAHRVSHPHPQLEGRFYRVAGTPPFWFVAVCLQQHGREDGFAPHNPFRVLFDRSGVVRTGEEAFDKTFVAQAARSLEEAWWRRVLVLKEVGREQLLEALAYYHSPRARSFCVCASVPPNMTMASSIVTPTCRERLRRNSRRSARL